MGWGEWIFAPTHWVEAIEGMDSDIDGQDVWDW